MVRKKSKKADLRQKRGTFFNVGLVIALAVTLLSFQWDTSTYIESEKYTADGYIFPEEFMVNVRPPEPPQPQPPQVVEQIEIVDDNVETKDEAVEIDIEIDVTDEIDEIIFDDIPEPDQGPMDIFKVESPAQFPGGEKALFRFIKENVKFPSQMRDMGRHGRVYVRFVIDKKGNVTSPEILRSPDKQFSDEAVRVINMLPKWQPAIQNLKPVAMYFRIPINFKLE